ncbi:MAG: hypothetical protein ABIG56_05710 [Candidatus Omnitrophota bacterium]
MRIQKHTSLIILKLYTETLSILKKYPLIYCPFLILALLEGVVLLLVIAIPREPLIGLFGPPIRVFLGENFLHYPINFYLLPKLFSSAQFFLVIVLGSLFSATVISMIGTIQSKEKLNFKISAIAAFKRYISLVAVTFTVMFLFRCTVKLAVFLLTKYFLTGRTHLLFLDERFWMGPILLFINFASAIFLQALFVYAIPILIIERESFFRSLTRAAILFRKLIIPTLILVGLPMLTYLPILILQFNKGYLINSVFPESIVLVTLVGMLLTTMVIDPLVTISTALFYLSKRKQ